MAQPKKQETITFKVDDELAQAMSAIPNRSEFIRSAIAAALSGVCPLCQGTGVLTLAQRRHWQLFASSHHVEECGDCHQAHLVCEQEVRAR